MNNKSVKYLYSKTQLSTYFISALILAVATSAVIISNMVVTLVSHDMRRNTDIKTPIHFDR